MKEGIAEPAFPALNVNITSQGMVLSILLGPTTSISQLIDPSSMDEIGKRWQEQKRLNEDEEEIIRTVQRTKQVNEHPHPHKTMS